MGFSGDDEFHYGGCLFPTGSCVDVYCPPRKRAHTSAQFAFSESEFECDNQPSIGVLPEECFFRSLVGFLVVKRRVLLLVSPRGGLCY
ncbi:hypothetical protein ACOSP7_013891 [Xanthoceras sorbifolium]